MFACVDLIHTEAEYSATKYQMYIPVVLPVPAFVPHFEFDSFLRRLFLFLTEYAVQCYT